MCTWVQFVIFAPRGTRGVCVWGRGGMRRGGGYHTLVPYTLGAPTRTCIIPENDIYRHHTYIYDKPVMRKGNTPNQPIANSQQTRAETLSVAAVSLRNTPPPPPAPPLDTTRGCRERNTSKQTNEPTLNTVPCHPLRWPLLNETRTPPPRPPKKRLLCT